jgi:hypothetical protein
VDAQSGERVWRISPGSRAPPEITQGSLHINGQVVGTINASRPVAIDRRGCYLQRTNQALPLAAIGGAGGGGGGTAAGARLPDP